MVQYIQALQDTTKRCFLVDSREAALKDIKYAVKVGNELTGYSYPCKSPKTVSKGVFQIALQFCEACQEFGLSLLGKDLSKDALIK